MYGSAMYVTRIQMNELEATNLNYFRYIVKGVNNMSTYEDVTIAVAKHECRLNDN